MLPFPLIADRLASFIIAELYRALPPPADASPDYLETRDLAAMAAVRHYRPANVAEAFLAVQAVAAQTHASDSLAAVSENIGDFKKMMQCRAQATSMMRQMSTALKELRVLQQERFRLEAMLDAEARAAEHDARREAETTEAPAREPQAAQQEDAAQPEAPDTPLPLVQRAPIREPSHDMEHDPADIDSETLARLAHLPPPVSHSISLPG